MLGLVEDDGQPVQLHIC